MAKKKKTTRKKAAAKRSTAQKKTTAKRKSTAKKKTTAKKKKVSKKKTSTKKKVTKRSASKKTASKKASAKQGDLFASDEIITEVKVERKSAIQPPKKKIKIKIPKAPATKDKTLKNIYATMIEVLSKGAAGRAPNLKIPVRSLKNVKYTPAKGYFELGKALKTRTLSVNTVKNFAQSLRMMSVSKDLIATDDFASKREMYYISKNWEAARFDEQPESDTVMDDIEAMMRVNREQLRFFPEEKGGDVAGALVVMDRDRSTGKQLKIDCTKFGSGAYSIPTSVEGLEFQTKAKFILVIETAAAFQRLVSKAYWKSANCILISMGGVPTRSCRRFIRRLADKCKLPVYVFTDGDPYGYGNIYRTLKVGSGNAAHINQYFCVPTAKFLGVTPQDIKDYKIPTHPLKEVDIKRAKDALKNDPFFQRYPQWQNALKQMISMGVRVEQQAFAKHGLNFVIDEYLPRKLKKTHLFLP